MPRREIKDQNGRVWDVWDVFPQDALRSPAYDRRNPVRPPDERTGDTRAPMLASDLEGGWLCFQSGDERRRFAPIPPQWAELPDGVLRVMLEIAALVPSSASNSVRSPTE